MQLNEYLRTHKLSPYAFAKNVGVSPQTVYRWLDGTRRPEWKRIADLVAATNGAVTADSFVAHKKSNTETPSTS